jgi:hypothetical protein
METSVAAAATVLLLCGLFACEEPQNPALGRGSPIWMDYCRTYKNVSNSDFRRIVAESKIECVTTRWHNRRVKQGGFILGADAVPVVVYEAVRSLSYQILYIHVGPRIALSLPNPVIASASADESAAFIEIDYSGGLGRTLYPNSDIIVATRELRAMIAKNRSVPLATTILSADSAGAYLLSIACKLSTCVEPVILIAPMFASPAAVDKRFMDISLWQQEGAACDARPQQRLPIARTRFQNLHGRMSKIPSGSRVDIILDGRDQFKRFFGPYYNLSANYEVGVHTLGGLTIIYDRCDEIIGAQQIRALAREHPDSIVLVDVPEFRHYNFINNGEAIRIYWDKVQKQYNQVRRRGVYLKKPS